MSRERLDKLRQLEAGWDSYGAVAPVPELYDLAEHVLRMLEGAGIEAHVVPLRHGGVQFEWGEHELEVGGAGRLALYLDDLDVATLGRVRGAVRGRYPTWRAHLS